MRQSARILLGLQRRGNLVDGEAVAGDVRQGLEVALDAGVEQVEDLLVATGLLVDPGQHAVQEADQLRHLRAHRDADLGDPLPGEAIRLVHGPRGHGS